MSAPALSWDTMPNMTKVELELILDANMQLFFEKGFRGRAFFKFKRLHARVLVRPKISI